ncbi:MAG: tetratricopeptide repeat protein [Cyanobacteria bacterium P01_E01_bin.42]
MGDKFYEQNYNEGTFYNADRIDITEVKNIYIQSADYQNLVERIEEKKELLELLPQTKQQRRLQLSGEIGELEQQLEEFKENVIRLAQIFSKIEINTERFKQAKAHFEKGEFREADAILKAEEMSQDLNKLIAREEELDRKKVEVKEGREQIANEFLIKARLWSTFYDRGDRWEKTCEYFEESLRGSRTAENLFEYAVFLQKHNQFKQSQTLYEEALQIYRELAFENPRIYLPCVADTLNNLALLHWKTNEIVAALEEYKEALQIFRRLVKENVRAYLPDVAMTLNNLALLHWKTNEIVTALEEYKEALQIFRGLAKENVRVYLPYVANILNNLVSLHWKTNEMIAALKECEEALQIRRKLASENPKIYLPDVADTLNTLANLYKDTNEQKEALRKYQEALQISRELASENSRAYLPNVALTLMNLSIFYLQVQPDRDKSIAFAKEVIEIARQFPQLPIVQKDAETALQVLAAHGIVTNESEE